MRDEPLAGLKQGLSDIRDACPGVGVDLIRKVFGRLKGIQIECLGRGQTAKWQRLK